jgi:hypothetical protein
MCVGSMLLVVPLCLCWLLLGNACELCALSHLAVLASLIRCKLLLCVHCCLWPGLFGSGWAIDYVDGII